MNRWRCEPYTIDGLAWTPEEIAAVQEMLQSCVPQDEEIPWLLSKEQWTPITIYYRAERNQYSVPVTFGGYTLEHVCQCVSNYYVKMAELDKKLRKESSEVLQKLLDTKEG